MAEAAIDPVPSRAEVQAKLAEIKRKKEAANLHKRDTKTRRALESKQHKERVNPALLYGDGQTPARDERWTILARPDLIKQVKQLAEDLSEPRAKVSVAALMEQAMLLLLAKYRGEHEGHVDGAVSNS